MAEAILSIRAECRSCGWLGMGHERKARNGATEDLYCPKCSGRTKSWVLDIEREQQPLERLKSARIEATQKANEALWEARLAHERLHTAQRATERARHRLAMLNKDDPQCLAAQRAMLVAEREESEAFLARAQADEAINR